MGTLIVDTIGGRNDNAPNQSYGLTVTGVATATAGFSGNIVSTAGTITTLTANTVSIGGTLTYNDVENIDSVGIITAQKGIIVQTNGIHVSAGICTFPTNSTIGGKVPASTGKAIAMAMIFG